MWVMLFLALASTITGAFALAVVLGLGRYAGVMPDLGTRSAWALMPMLGAAIPFFWIQCWNKFTERFGGTPDEPRKRRHDIVQHWILNIFYIAYLGILDYAFIVKAQSSFSLIGWVALGFFHAAGLINVILCARKSVT